MTTTESTGSPNVAQRVLSWLEAGYPEGVPPQDRFPLVALLQRRLTDEQTRRVVGDLTNPGALKSRGDDPISSDEIEELISRHLHESPSPEDVSRVSARLAAAGWPLAESIE
jgi:hypothetical protein